MTIHLAVKEGQLKVVQEMIHKGTSVDHKNLNQDTPLHYACLYGRPEIVSFLLSQDADTDKKNSDGKMPLHLAAYYNDFDSVKLLIEHGAIFTEVDNDNNTPLNYAVRNDNFGMITYLIKKSEENGIDVVNDLFLDSANRCSWELLDFLHINYGAFIYKDEELNQLFKNALTLKNSIALQHIIQYAHELENGSNIKEKLFLLMPSVLKHIISYVYELENRLNAKEKLFLLAATNSYDSGTLLIKFFLDNDVNINAKNSLDQNALHIAMQERSPSEETIKLLIEKGCDLNVKDIKGNTPMHYFKESLEKMKSLFNDNGRHRAMANFFLANEQEFIQYLFDKGADPKLNNSTFIEKFP